jgi:hypothetical protein
MSAPAITLTAEEAEAIARARAALAWIGSDDFPWPSFGSGAIKMHADGLRESLNDHAALTATPARAHPADLFPDLGRGQDNALELALNLITLDIREWTRELVRLGNKAEEARAREEEVAA